MQSVQEVTDQRPSNAFQPEASMIDAKSFAELLTFDTVSRICGNSEYVLSQSGRSFCSRNVYSFTMQSERDSMGSIVGIIFAL